ncbi:MAG: carboxymuconolactone decarboxylase family protein [Bacteroidales bacterium]|nr:carboxymuconolactone decarboxylase family protein [Bacteroidales bacterium]MCF8333882.1 carboxymuconolactone decarboxylase family protein [Bacteroidales bacterium]
MNKPTQRHYLSSKEKFPEYFKKLEELGEQTKNQSPFDEKTIQLIQLAGSVANASEGATHSHTKQALEAGASAEEIQHTVLLLTNTIGFPATMAGLSWVNDIVEAP